MGYHVYGEITRKAKETNMLAAILMAVGLGLAWVAVKVIDRVEAN